MKYEDAVIEVEVFANGDVITTSSESEPCEYELVPT